eukprot:15817465-Heterocapsa_arctica.AAC.1
MHSYLARMTPVEGRAGGVSPTLGRGHRGSPARRHRRPAGWTGCLARAADARGPHRAGGPGAGSFPEDREDGGRRAQPRPEGVCHLVQGGRARGLATAGSSD